MWISFHILQPSYILTHCWLVTLDGDIGLGQHWPRYWLVARQHQAINWTNVDLSPVMYYGIHLRTISQHYTDVIMTTIASQITSLTVVYSNVYSDADQRKHQRSASLAFVWGIHRDRWIPRTKGQLRGKCFHLMTSSWQGKYGKY